MFLYADETSEPIIYSFLNKWDSYTVGNVIFRIDLF